MQWSANRHCQPYGPWSIRCRSPSAASAARMPASAARVRGGGPADPRVGPVDDPHPRVGAQRVDDRGAVADQRPVADAGPIALPGRGVQTRSRPSSAQSGAPADVVIELRPTDLADPGVGIEVVERSGQPIPTGRPADEGDVVRLVLVGDAAALVALAVPDLDVHGLGEAEHPEVLLDLVEVEHHPNRCRSTRVSSAPLARAKATGRVLVASTSRPVSGRSTITTTGRRVASASSGTPPLLELVRVLRPDREEQRHRLVRHRAVRRDLAREPARGQLVAQLLAGQSGVAPQTRQPHHR